MGAGERAAGPMRQGAQLRDRCPVTTTVQPTAAIAVDVAAPLALFYALRAHGVGDVPALVASAVPPAANIVVTAVRRRRVDALAIAVLAGTGPP